MVFRARTEMSQPQTPPAITCEKLVVEARCIYRGLVLIERKCIELHEAQIARANEHGPPDIKDDYWQALIAIHRTLLHEHHDFFLASQHPNACPHLRQLALEFDMPARMWRHGIRSFLELLRMSLPHSLEHMLSFIYLSYNMMALLFEMVPAYRNKWVEYLGDLGRSRAEIERADSADQNIWADVAQRWHSWAEDKNTPDGSLYHYRAILSRSGVLQRLFHYGKRLVLTERLRLEVGGRDDFDWVFNRGNIPNEGSHRVNIAFLELHRMLLGQLELKDFDENLENLLGILRKDIADSQSSLKGNAYYMALCNIFSLFEYGRKSNILQLASLGLRYGSDGRSKCTPIEESSHQLGSPQTFLDCSKRLGYGILGLFLERDSGPDLPHLYIWLVFIKYASNSRHMIDLLEKGFPWGELVSALNLLLSEVEHVEFLDRAGLDGCVLPEDHALKGLPWAEEYFPESWFQSGERQGSDEIPPEEPSMRKVRIKRILCLAHQIAKSNATKFSKMGFELYPTNTASGKKLVSRTEGLDLMDEDMEISTSRSRQGSPAGEFPKPEAEPTSESQPKAAKFEAMKVLKIPQTRESKREQSKFQTTPNRRGHYSSQQPGGSNDNAVQEYRKDLGPSLPKTGYGGPKSATLKRKASSTINNRISSRGAGPSWLTGD